MKRRHLAAVAMVVLSLTACAQPGIQTDPTPPATSTPEASVTPEAPVAASVIVSSEAIAVLADDETELGRFGYFDPSAEPAIAALTEAFGAEPETTERVADMHSPSSTAYNWSGFELIAFHDRAPEFPEVDTFWVAVTTAAVGDIAVSGPGVAVGMEAVAASPQAFRHWTDTGTGTSIDFYLFDQVPVELDYTADYEPAALSVRAWVTGKDRLVTRIDAPSRNFGA